MFRFPTREKSWCCVFIFLLGFFLILCGCAATRFDAYVISKENQKLTVIDFDNNKLLQEVEGSPFDTGVGPSDITYDPRQRRLYVTNSEENTLSIFRINRVEYREVLEPLDEISVKLKPVSVTVDTRHNLVLILHDDGTLLRLTGSDFSYKDEHAIFYVTNPYGKAAGMAYDARNNLLYVIDQAANALVILDGETLKYVNVIPTGSKPSAITYDYRNNRVYVTNFEDSTLSVYKAGPFCSLIKTMGVGFLQSGPSDLAYDERNNRIYIALGAVHKVSVIDAEELRWETAIYLPAMSTPVSVATGLIDGTGPPLLYVANSQIHNVSVFEIELSDGFSFTPLPDTPIPVPNIPVGIATTPPACPEIRSLDPQEAKAGETVTILGTGFKGIKGLSLVAFGGVAAREDDILSWSETKIDVKVSPFAKSGVVRVIVGNVSSGPPDGELVKEFIVIPHAHIYVNAREGNDHWSGTETYPYKTITHALSQAQPSDVIHILPGRYDRELGERFPLRISEGVHIEGWSALSVDIRPHGTGSAVVMKEGASIKELNINGEEATSPPATGIVCDAGCVVEDSAVRGFQTGIMLEGNLGENSSLITDSNISSNDDGISVSSNVNAKIVHNHFFHNKIGVYSAGNACYVESNEFYENYEIAADLGGRSVFLLGNNFNRNFDPDRPNIGTGISGGTQNNMFTIGNHITNSATGIRISAHYGKHIIRGNTVYGCRRKGIVVSGKEPCIILDNWIEYSQDVGIYHSGHCNIDGNRIYNNGDGIWVSPEESGTNTIINRNFIRDNERYGISIYNGTIYRVRADVEDNTITGNEVGVHVSDYGASYMYRNTIENNEVGVAASSGGSLFIGSLEHHGNNCIRNNSHVGLINNNRSVISAVGNFWNPNVQGANENGEYRQHQTAYGPVPVQDGNNYAITKEAGGIQF